MMTKRILSCVFFIMLYFFFTSPALFSKVKVIEPDKDNINPGKLLTAAGELDISNFLSKDEIDKNNIPALIPVQGDHTLIALWRKERVLIIDTVNRKAVQRIDLPSVENIFRIQGTDYFLVVNKEKEKDREISRYEIGSGKATWTAPFDMVYGFNWGSGNFYRKIHFPVIYKLIKDTGNIFFTGMRILGEGKQSYYSNRLLFIEAETGKIIREHDYHYRRNVEGTLELYVDKEKKIFEVIDISNGTSWMKGTYNDEDIPDDVNRYSVIDHSRISGFSNVGGGFSSNWEFSPLLLDKGLLISVRRFVSKLKFGVTQSYWVIIDPEKGQRKKIEPAPLGGVDMALRNMSGKKWPVIVPHVIYQSGLRRPKSNSFWVINSDGSMKQITAPPNIPEEKIRFTYNPYNDSEWIHDGEYIYYLHSPAPKLFKNVVSDRKLFKIKIGESQAQLIYTYGDKEMSSSIFSGSPGYLVLTGLERRRLVKVPEGKEIAETDFSDNLGTSIWRSVSEKKYFETWKQVEDVRFLHKNLPEDGRPQNYRKFSAYNYKSKNFIRDLSIRKLVVHTLPTVWGARESFLNIRDIGLMPMRLKDKTWVFCGIDIIKNKIEFYLPILFIDRNNFLISTAVLNGTEAVLTVMADLSAVKFYKIKRPGK